LLKDLAHKRVHLARKGFAAHSVKLDLRVKVSVANKSQQSVLPLLSEQRLQVSNLLTADNSFKVNNLQMFSKLLDNLFSFHKLSQLA